MGLNKILRESLGVEVKRSSERGPEEPPETARDKTDDGRTKMGYDSFFWNPYAEGSPFRDRKKYIAQFKRERESHAENAWRYRATDLVSEEDIRLYVEALAEDGCMKQISGLSSLLVPKTVYANVVKVALHVFQVAFGTLDGKSVLGRRLHLLKDRSHRAHWRVSKKYRVQPEIVAKLVKRIMADHAEEPDIMSQEVQRQMYENIVSLVFRLVFDLIDSYQLRVLGHAVTLNIEVDDDIAAAPGWEIDLDSGIFGRFDLEHKQEFAKAFVEDLLMDESINIAALPDVLERQLYMRVVMLQFDLLETACNHMRMHMAGIAIRPAMDDL